MLDLDPKGQFDLVVKCIGEVSKYIIFIIFIMNYCLLCNNMNIERRARAPCFAVKSKILAREEFILYKMYGLSIN